MPLTLPQPGTIFSGRYRLERALGQGASSIAFAAHDLKLDRAVAVKVLKAAPAPAGTRGSTLERRRERNDDVQREDFLREARLLAKLAHPHVVPVFDVGEQEDGLAFFVMELAGEQTLARELESRGALDLEDTLKLLLPLMGALAVAHDAGIIHRDLKPANIVLDAREGPLRAKLLDFGIAKFAGHTSQASADTENQAVGTPAYMAPEQARAEQVGPEADVWAMGVLFFRCLTGTLPFDAASATGVLLKLAQERAPRFKVACPSLAPHVAVALDQALEPNPHARPKNMRELARQLAIACRQDDVQVPREPDALGLPLFAKWMHQADIEETRKTPVRASEERALAEAPVGLSSRSPAREPARARYAAVLACVLLATGFVFALRDARAREKAVPNAQPTLADVYSRRDGAERLPDAFELQTRDETQLTGLVSAPPILETDAKRSSKEPARPVRKLIAKPRAPQKSSITQDSPAPQLIKQWDW